jgi:hypothetical protein
MHAMADDSFVRRETDGVAYYACRALEAVPGLCHGFSTRHGGAGEPPSAPFNLGFVSWDPRERVEENRRRFLGALGLEGASLCTLAQVHSDRVHIIEESGLRRNERPEADALAAVARRTALAVQAADCFPVLVLDPARAAIAAIHAGWRGTVAHIVRKSVEVLAQRFGADPESLVAAIGPGIRACCFEVGSEVVEAFAREFPGSGIAGPRPGVRDKSRVDLPRAIALELQSVGLAAANVHDLAVCTRCTPEEFFSYRGERSRSGRQMGVIGWKG